MTSPFSVYWCTRRVVPTLLILLAVLLIRRVFEVTNSIVQDNMQGLFHYKIETTWNGLHINHQPVVIELKKVQEGVEMNVTAPFFDDPAPPNSEPGKPYFKLWDYEVVEMFFLNDDKEYLEVEFGPHGQHLLLLLKGDRNAITHSLPLQYIVTSKEKGSSGEPGVWHGSAVIPFSYFPPKVSRVNAYAIHGTGDNRVYESLYAAPSNDVLYPQPDFHRLELFKAIDFQCLVPDNSKYSQVWVDAIKNNV